MRIMPSFNWAYHPNAHCRHSNWARLEQYNDLNHFHIKQYQKFIASLFVNFIKRRRSKHSSRNAKQQHQGSTNGMLHAIWMNEIHKENIRDEEKATTACGQTHNINWREEQFLVSNELNQQPNQNNNKKQSKTKDLLRMTDHIGHNCTQSNGHNCTRSNPYHSAEPQTLQKMLNRRASVSVEWIESTTNPKRQRKQSETKDLLCTTDHIGHNCTWPNPCHAAEHKKLCKKC